MKGSDTAATDDPLNDLLTGEREKFLFRRQFLLGPEFADSFPSWKRVSLRDDLRLTVHPDLRVTRARDEARSVTLLGYALDSSDPDATDAAIVAGLLEILASGGDVSELIRSSDRLGGRWVVIADDGSDVVLFHDALGLRQVFFTSPEYFSPMWCASQPSLLAEVLRLSPGETETVYMRSDVYREDAEAVWPGDTCAFREVRHLLPNHRLSIRTGTCSRYWPEGSIGSADLEDAVDRVCRMLTALIEGASRRFPLALASTAGWDTRLILAASRAVAGGMWCYTLLRPENRADVTGTPRLLSRVGLPHRMIPFPERMHPKFEELYKRSVTEAHEFWGRMAQALLVSYPPASVSVTGNAAEVTRQYFELPTDREVTPRDLASLTSSMAPDPERLEDDPYVVGVWKKWLAGIDDLHGVRLSDLFYWEHRGGNFAAMGESEWDIVQEAFTPVDCRLLLTTMLSVDESEREYGDPRLYRVAIRRLWPELLKEPINEPYEGPLTGLFRIARGLQLNRMLPRRLRERARRLLQSDAN